MMTNDDSYRPIVLDRPISTGAWTPLQLCRDCIYLDDLFSCMWKFRHVTVCDWAVSYI